MNQMPLRVTKDLIANNNQSVENNKGVEIFNTINSCQTQTVHQASVIGFMLLPVFLIPFLLPGLAITTTGNNAVISPIKNYYLVNLHGTASYLSPIMHLSNNSVVTMNFTNSGFIPLSIESSNREDS
ncbi:hypothetical protein [Kaarinaea lacus]